MDNDAAGEANRSSLARADVAAAGERVVRPEFTGSASEYFRIWIVNLFFTLITFGIYSAWAKVRKKCYFYGSKRLDGDSFDYFGNPKTILAGRFVAVIVLLVYAFTIEIYPMSQFAFIGAFLLLLPWLVVRALTFNARNSAYRGVRFDFLATSRQALPVFLGMPLLVGISAGTAYSWFVARSKTFVVSHHTLGTTRFGCELRGRDFFKTYFLSGLMLLVLVIPIGVLMGVYAPKLDLPAGIEWLAFVGPLILMYASYLAVYAYVQARTINLQWNGTEGPGLQFASTLQARKLMRIYFGNIVAIAATAGLLIPWAVVRTLRYRLESFSVTAQGEEIFAANPDLEGVGATGQEFGDIFNLDLGL